MLWFERAAESGCRRFATLLCVESRRYSGGRAASVLYSVLPACLPSRRHSFFSPAPPPRRSAGESFFDLQYKRF